MLCGVHYHCGADHRQFHQKSANQRLEGTPGERSHSSRQPPARRTSADSLAAARACMSLKRRISLAAMIGTAVWFVAQAGFYLSWLASGFFGSVVYGLFSALAFWPLGILSLFLSDTASGWLQWPMLNVISLLGWLLFAVFVGTIFHFVSIGPCRRIVHENNSG
jgi:hypothetical protein